MTTVSGIVTRRSPYLERYVQLGIASNRVIRVTFPTEPAPDAAEEHPLIDRIFEYLEGGTADFADVELALTVPTDHRRILEATREIPYGEGIDVATLASRIPEVKQQDEEELQLLRTVLAENPVPLLIPDHRVRDAPSAAPPGVEQRLRSLEGL